MILCSHCNRECKNANAHRNHERLCQMNPTRQISWLEQHRSTITGKNGAMAAAERGEQYIISPETRQKMSNATSNRTSVWKEAHSRQVSATIQKKVSEGNWHTSLARHMHIQYNGVDLHGQWELAYAKYLDASGIKWIRNTTQFAYEFQGKMRKYTPDFYLPDTQEYVEIKGYKTEKDVAKWRDFPTNQRLTVLMKHELKALGII